MGGLLVFTGVFQSSFYDLIKALFMWLYSKHNGRDTPRYQGLGLQHVNFNEKVLALYKPCDSIVPFFPSDSVQLQKGFGLSAVLQISKGKFLF